MRETAKMTYTDGRYFCNACDTPHEGESLAEECFDQCEELEANDTTITMHDED